MPKVALISSHCQDTVTDNTLFSVHIFFSFSLSLLVTFYQFFFVTFNPMYLLLLFWYICGWIVGDRKQWLLPRYMINFYHYFLLIYGVFDRFMCGMRKQQTKIKNNCLFCMYRGNVRELCKKRRRPTTTTTKYNKIKILFNVITIIIRVRVRNNK